MEIPARSRSWIDPLAIFLLAAAVRLVYLLEYRGSPFYDFLHLDPRYYQDWALRIASGEWLGTQVFEQSPLYPYLLAGFLSLFGTNLTLLYSLQLAAGAFTAVLACLLGRRLFGRMAGLAAGAGAALYGPFLFYEGQVMKEFLTPLFSVATLLLVAAGLGIGSAGKEDGRRAGSIRLLALAGALIGLATLVRDNFLLLAPILGLYVALAGPWPRARRLRAAAALLLGSFLVILPVTVRNFVVSRELVLTTSGGGEVFYIGNGPYANGAYAPPPWVRPRPPQEHEDFRKRARELTGRDLSRAEASRFWFGEGLKTILRHRSAYPGLVLRKLLIFLNDHELPDNYSYYSFRGLSRLLSLLPTFGVFLALGCVGVIASAGRWREMMPLYLGGAGYLASVLIFFNFARFRLPFVPVLMLFAGLGAVTILREASSRRWRRLALHAAVLAVVLAGSHVTLPWGREAPLQDSVNLAAAYRHQGRTPEAESILRETIREGDALLESHGGPASAGTNLRVSTFVRLLKGAHGDLAAILQEESRNEEAIDQLAGVVALDPGDAGALWRLGRAYESVGDLPSARRIYERGLDVAPDSFSLRFGHAATLLRMSDFDGAWRELGELHRRNPEIQGTRLANWHYAMGLTLYALPGRRAEAVPHLESGLQLNPAHPQAGRARSLLRAVWHESG